MGSHDAPHSGWNGSGHRAKVLIEHPDAAEAGARAEAIKAAGFDVAMCLGPRKRTRVPWLARRRAAYWEDEPQPSNHAQTEVCTLLTHGDCPLVADADLVLTSKKLTQATAIHSALRGR